MIKRAALEEQARTARSPIAVARTRLKSAESVSAIVFETSSKALHSHENEPGVDETAGATDIRTEASYALSPDGIAVRLESQLTNNECSLMIDSALHYRIEVDPDDWDSVAINAFLALAVPEVFAYQRPLFDQMALLVDASRPTPSLSSFRRAAKSAREQHDSSVSEQP